jgi:hypothetical protein
MSTSVPSSRPDPVPNLVQRLVAASGIAFALLFVVLLILTGESVPEDDDPLREWTQYARDNEENLRIGLLVFGLAAYNFFLFLGYLRSVMGEAELRLRGFTRAGFIILAAGTAGIIGMGVGIGISAGAIAYPDTTPPEVLRALNDLGGAGWVMASAGFGAMFVTVALVNAAVRALPSWLGWIALVCGLSFVLQLGVLLSEDEDNFFGIFYPIGFLMLLVFCASASVVFLREQSRPLPTSPV